METTTPTTREAPPTVSLWVDYFLSVEEYLEVCNFWNAETA